MRAGVHKCADGGTAEVLFVDDAYAFGYHYFHKAAKVCCIWVAKTGEPISLRGWSNDLRIIATPAETVKHEE